MDQGGSGLKQTILRNTFAILTCQTLISCLMFSKAKELISIIHPLVFTFRLIKLKVRQIVKHLMRVVYCYKMAQAMISQQKCMEVDLDLDRIGSQMIELLGGRKQQSVDQLDRNFFQDYNKTQEKSKKKEKPTATETRTRTITAQQRSKPSIF